MITALHSIGRYFLMIKEAFNKPIKRSIIGPLIFKEIEELINQSMGIVCFISFFIGAVVAMQTALNLNNPIIPKYLIAFATRQSVILEFSPTFISIVLAGRAGSYIASSIGTMRVTEQIDALEVMGINSVNYLVFPKIVAFLLYPFVISISIFLGIAGGWIAGVYGGFISSEAFQAGLQTKFIPFHITYAFIKSFFFGFVLATIPAYHGYYLKGGALEVGKASTNSFIWCCVVIILIDFILTEILLG